jgi:predicted dehydrogenase
MSKTSIGIVGAGAIGRLHADKILQSDFAVLSGIADPTDAGRAFAEKIGVPWFADRREMLDRGKPEAAIIATPNATHRAVALDFIAAGVPAVVEKPIASTIADGEAIAAASEKAGVPVLVGHHRRHNPIIRRARAMIAEGVLGRIATAAILYSFYKPPEYFDLEWRKQPGGGPVLINLIHEIDLVRHLCGEIASVQAIASNAIRGFEVEDTAAVVLRLVNGALVTITLCDTAVTPWSWDLASGELPSYPVPAHPVTTHFLCGTDGSLGLPALEFWSYKGVKSWFAPISRDQIAFERGDPYIEQLKNLCGVARGEQQPLVSARDGTQTLRATLAVLEAAKTGQTVAVKSG